MLVCVLVPIFLTCTSCHTTFIAWNCSLAASNLPITAGDKISAAQIQNYFEEASGKKDWSKRAWAEWCTMEKGLHQESMEQLSEVKSPFFMFLCFYLNVYFRMVYFCFHKYLPPFLHVQVFKSSRGFCFRRGCLLAMVGVTVNEVCHSTNNFFNSKNLPQPYGSILSQVHLIEKLWHGR